MVLLAALLGITGIGGATETRAAMAPQQSDSLAALARPGAAGDGNRGPLILHASRLTGEITLDGRLDEAAWAAAEVADGFTQYEPTPGAPASQRTEVRGLYGDDALWVAIRAHDSAPDSITAQLTRRDQDSWSDEVAVVIDSYFDRRTAFHFQVNAVGVKSDFFRFDDIGEDRGWDAVWDVATARDEGGWTAEFRIPYSQLRFRDAPEQRWGVNFIRRIARHGELSVWAPLTPEVAAVVSRFGELRGLRDLAPPLNLEVTPYSVARLTRAPGDAGNPFHRRNDLFGSVGADLKYGVTTDLTLNVTINPDFGQVEADPGQINLSAFETFLPERRPFFVEGSNLFSFGLGVGDGDGANESLFYSRRIGRPPQGAPRTDGGWSEADASTTILGAWKLSGKTASGWSIGILNAVTSEERAQVAPLEGAPFEQPVEPFTNTAVARVQKDFREGGSAIGIIGTAVNRDPEVAGDLRLRSAAYAAGIDARHRFADGRWEVSGYLLGSHLRGSEGAIADLQRAPARLFHREGADHLGYDPTRTSLSGVAATATIFKIGGGHWRFGTGILSRSPGFDTNDAGFMREADFGSTFLYVGYDQSSPQGVFRSWRLNFNAWNSFYWSNLARASSGGNVNGQTQLTNFWSAYAGLGYNATGLSSGTLRGGPDFVVEPQVNWWGGIGTDTRKALRFNLNFTGHHFPDHEGRGFNLSPTVWWRPSGRATLSLGTSWSHAVSDRQWVGQYGGAEAPAYLLAKLDQTSVGVTGRLDLALAPTLSVQLYAQPFIASGRYDAFKRVTDPRGERYRDRFTLLDLARESQGWMGDIDGDGEPDGLPSPDFEMRQFRSNTVLRWEYRPGSTLFVVWAQGRDGVESLFDQRPSNVFMVKLSYWMTP